MKLIGFREIKGEKNGRKWDFIQLVIDREEPNSDICGGVQLLMRNWNGVYSLPSVSVDVWRSAIKDGVRIGSSVNLYQDFNGKVNLTLADSPFQDIV